MPLPALSVAESVKVGDAFVVGVVVVIDGDVGAVTSGFKTYVFELVGPPPVSEMRMRTVVVVFVVGVNVYESVVLFAVHVDPPSVEYATAVRGDGVAVSVMVQVVAGFVFCHVPLV